MVKRAAYRITPELFWQHYVSVKSEDECWEWKGAIDRAGYGLCYFAASILAHRHSYFLSYGEFDRSLCVLHKCDNRSCVNPRHLFLGTQLDNIADMVAKGRRAKQNGAKNSRAKLSEQDVEIIRTLRGTMSGRRIGMMFGVKKHAINKILSGKSWSSSL